MKNATTEGASSDPAACLHQWLSDHAGADPDGDHLAAALTTRHRWLAMDDASESGVLRIVAVCNAVLELYAAEDWAVMERTVCRLDQSAKALRALLDDHSDVPKAAAAKQDGYMVMSKMDGPATSKAANAFGLGPLKCSKG